MSGTETRVNLLSGESALVSNQITFDTLRQRIGAIDKLKAEQAEIYVNGTIIDMNEYGGTKIANYRDEDGCAVQEINIGRSLSSGASLGDTSKIDQKLVDSAMNEKTAPTPVLRGYTGHVPGRKYAYGLANSLADKQHMLPPEIVEQAENGVHYQADAPPTLGYSGFVRGSQHIAGRTYSLSLKTAMNNDYKQLAQGSLLPPEPQHSSRRNFSLEDVRRHVRTL